MLHLRHILRSCALAAATLAALAPPALASTLQGRVLDAQQRPIPGAQVRAENEATSLRREATTDQGGSFTLPELPPGSYTQVAEALPGGDHHTLIASITGKLWPIGDDTVFIPGHGPESTFGRERRSNPYVSGT